MKTSTVAIIIIAILIIAGGAWWYTHNNTAAPSTQTTTVNNAGGTDYTVPADTTGTSTASSSASVPKTVTVSYNASSGFSPKSVSVKAGDTVTFTSANGDMWIGSNVHPTHTEYDGTSRTTHCAPGYTGEKPFDECATGATYSFTFTKVGTFQYHNHVAPQNTGTIIVQ